MADRVTVERATVDIPAADRVTVVRPVTAERAATVDRPAFGAQHGGPYLDEREEARARLKASVDALAERANLQVQMQKEPLKMLGGASAVGAAAGTLLGIVLGRQFQRTKKIYVDADSPEKDQKALIRAQKKEKGGTGVGGALVATLTTLGIKVLNDRVLTPKLEEFAHGLLDRAGQEGGQKARNAAPRAAGQPRPAAQQTGGNWSLSGSRPAPAPANTDVTASFLKRDEGAEASDAARVGVPGGPSVPGTGSSIPVPVSTVQAKAQGSPIGPEEKTNPNIR
ncbi:hypothetical protein E5F05_16685 [Deinococcus metallilatus]|uniref:Uncharacterized protein n=1 Tax=Deinococcus metallilatus TaxID=1211322 RepID=A0AAJ5K5P3_9DEIO|nr:hypothetical protein [Deinococcus metallilatus]MBB5294853.1 hypothetical protein [Deinococcus metallilatus]QBY09430.1 hypothetical protein E5F05_16685 [Deinococcus metallilatus]RXJ09435.1 hypothetical protein ERJ73_15525 [Deinococcus metallilatus]TLK28958.1 hypothetical protein FCS05_07290 [Deinococcus metallilatus]GMA16780.1 hypothetical protein GCM10025871_31110 [Deinococcus metallilatus]